MIFVICISQYFFRREGELLELKRITFDKELMNAVFNEKQGENHDIESARIMVQRVKRSVNFFYWGMNT
jgi:hypothetical protein